MTTQVVRLGAIGTGGIFGAHAKNLKHIGGNQIVAVCDVSEPNRTRWSNELGAKPYSEISDLFANEKLDAVFVCTPPTVRLQVVEAAAKVKVPVFFEKPPAFKIEDASAILKIMKKSKLPVVVGFMYRYLPSVLRMKQLIGDRPINLVQSSFFCPAATIWQLPGWFYIKERSGGHILDQAVHVMDLVRFIGGDISLVHTLGNNVIRPKADDFNIEDSSATSFRFTSGASGTHVHSWTHSEFTGFVTVVGKDYRLSLQLDNTLTGFVGETKIDEKFQPAPDGLSHHYFESIAFLEQVRTKNFSSAHSPYQDAAKSLSTVIAMNQSIETGKPVKVKLKL
jgi:predicted dehydrogenase